MHGEPGEWIVTPVGPATEKGSWELETIACVFFADFCGNFLATFAVKHLKARKGIAEFAKRILST